MNTVQTADRKMGESMHTGGQDSDNAKMNISVQRRSKRVYGAEDT